MGKGGRRETAAQPPLHTRLLSVRLGGLTQRTDGMDDTGAQAADQGVNPGQWLEDQFVLALIGLVPVADISGDIAKIAVELDRIDLGEDQAELAHNIVDLQMEDLRQKLLPGDVI